MTSVNSLQCNWLTNAGLGALVLYPTDSGYADREASYWAANTPLHPQCIVQPRTTDDVSRIVQALSQVDGKAVVRSGGHMQWAGANDIHDGVTVDLGLMTDVSYDPETTLASIQPGPRWGDVFEALDAKGACVAGGRDANVGIAGFLTGGGNSYYTGQMGMACDSVVNFEVVLGSGEVVNANAKENPDLWKALKGGSGNFGIVTRFDMQAFPSSPIWGGMRASPRSAGSEIATSLINFVNNNENNPQDAYIINFTYNPSMFSEVVVASVIVDTKGVVNATAFDEIQKIPTLIQDVKTRTMTEIARSYVLPSGEQQVWFSLTFKNDADIVNKAADLHDQLVEDLQGQLPAGNFTTQCLFQPMPTLFAKRSVAQGGNVLGMDSVHENALLWLLTISVKTEEQQKLVEPKAAAFASSLEKFARSKDGMVNWRYLNYVDKTQEPFQSYGADNVHFLKEVAAKYDPTCTFQEKFVGGFKLSNV